MLSSTWWRETPEGPPLAHAEGGVPDAHLLLEQMDVPHVSRSRRPLLFRNRRHLRADLPEHLAEGDDADDAHLDLHLWSQCRGPPPPGGSAEHQAALRATTHN